MTREPPQPGATAMAEAVRQLYRQGQTDYALEPIVMTDGRGDPVGRVEDGDAVIFCCRRGEREVQLTEAFVERDWDRFPRRDLPRLTFVLLTLYHEKFKGLPVAFAPTRIKNTLGEVVSRAGLSQIRIAESEKFSHVTFFLNGGRQKPFEGEHDRCVPSPRGQPFEQIPGLSLAQVTQAVQQGVQDHYNLIVTNFANGDVIGHTTSREAKILCAEAADDGLGQVVQAALGSDYVVLVTADHGNLEVMSHSDGSPHVSHTDNPVPFLYLDQKASSGPELRDGKLADVAPTALRALGLAQPFEMEGASLLRSGDFPGRRRVLLVILDGWGIGRQDDSNPIWLARTEVWSALIRKYSSSQLLAAGEAVGLKPGKAGNSEAGHMNIGAGRVVLQDDVRLDHALEDGSFSDNPTLRRVIEDVQSRKTSLHLIGLLSERSSHGSIDYPLALMRMAQACGLRRVYLHVIFDGRSSEPGSAPLLLEKLEGQLQDIGVGCLASGVGRGIALDRDGNYAKTQMAYEAIVNGTGVKCALSG